MAGVDYLTPSGDGSGLTNLPRPFDQSLNQGENVGFREVTIGPLAQCVLKPGVNWPETLQVAGITFFDGDSYGGAFRVTAEHGLSLVDAVLNCHYGFSVFGAAPVTIQPQKPTTLGDVIALLAAYGFCMA